MDGFIVLVCGIVALMFLASTGGDDAEKRQALENLQALKRFVVYVEDHKEELPDNMRERFDELEKQLGSK